MSRGLSQQQRQILGLGYSVNVAFNGAYRKPEGNLILPGEAKSRCRCAALVSLQLPDLITRLAVHVVGGIEFADVGVYSSTYGKCVKATGMFDWQNRDGGKSAKASITRSVSTLLKNGYLVYRPPTLEVLKALGIQPTKLSGYGEHHDYRVLVEEHVDSCGYYLTDKGAEVGKDHPVENQELRQIAAQAFANYIPGFMPDYDPARPGGGRDNFLERKVYEAILAKCYQGVN